MIKFVYFDVGGVAILDFSGTAKWEELKQELGITQKKNTEFEEFWKKYEADRLLGGDVEKLLPLLKQLFGLSLPENYSLLIDGFVKRFEVNKSIWPVVERIHRKCKVGLLTNQYFGMLEAIKKKGMLPNILWDVVIDSSVDRIQKPNKKIFELGETKAEFKGKEILFVENSLGHIKAAQEFGWQTFLYDPKAPKLSSKKLLEYFSEKVS